MNRRQPAPGFDFSGAMRRLCEDLVLRLPQLGHVDVSRVAVACNMVRKHVAHGLQASLTPLRFAGGALYAKRGRHRWTIQRLYDESSREMLYILRFYLPRFANQTFAEKLCTVVHELWHISPNFDGDLRRFPGRFYAHSASERAYDSLCHALADRWLALDPPRELVELLDLDFPALSAGTGASSANRFPFPSLSAWQPTVRADSAPANNWHGVHAFGVAACLVLVLSAMIRGCWTRVIHQIARVLFTIEPAR